MDALATTTDPAPAAALPVLGAFHPAVAEWFRRRFPEGPTPPQVEAWPLIAAGHDTLVAAPTGSGKTLAGFLVSIDALYRAHEAGGDVGTGARVVYVSPLKALAVDIAENLQRPLSEIAAIATEMGLDPPAIRVGVRTGDTTSSERTAMVRKPPAFVVTTPESLYLLLTSERGRDALRSVETVIVDEIHAVARDKRGAHLAITLERLEAVCARRPVRIGLSATQRPVETVGRLLVGDRPLPRIVDVGHQRKLELSLELPEGELEAVVSAEQMADVFDNIAAHVAQHKTTLVFVNTRRLAERVAHQLGERLGDDVVSAHHGSLSKERRYRIETRLRAGDLKALVATASLELGIDIGPVELVCQIGSPRSIATFLQRVGRSNHTRSGTPRGIVYPLTRDELVECSALIAAVKGGRLDAIELPRLPLDILAQQVVAEVAAQEWRTDDLYDLVRRAAPYNDLTREKFAEIIALVSDGIETGRGKRGAYLHHDGINGELRPRGSARLSAVTSGGAIPETGDYRVLAEPDDTFVGTVNEDWATESMAGDIFLLGTHSWQIRKVEPGVVRVRDAGDLPPTIPFWLGEAPARTAELSEEVSSLRLRVDRHLTAGDPDGARRWLVDVVGIPPDAAAMIVDYIAVGRAALGVVPSHECLVVERFFDDTGGMQLVVHSPLGGRINRGLGLALRKKFCRSFNFELQAAATDDAIVLSLGPHHSFPLDEVPRYVHSKTVHTTLEQAILDSPMFQARWRWNLNRSLMVLRFRNGRRNPPPIQRMESDDLMAAVFPSAAACQENVSFPIEIPDHLLVRQTVDDTLHEALDADGLRDLFERIEGGEVRVHCVDTTEPSVLAHEILTARPYAFLDDEEAQNRRTNAVTLRRGLSVDLSSIGALDPEAIERVHEEIVPVPTTADDLHDLLASMLVVRARPDWQRLFGELAAKGRVQTIDRDGTDLWCTTEALDDARQAIDGEDEAVARALRGHLEISGITTVERLAHDTTLPAGRVRSGLAALQQHGFAMQGHYTGRLRLQAVDEIEAAGPERPGESPDVGAGRNALAPAGAIAGEGGLPASIGKVLAAAGFVPGTPAGTRELAPAVPAGGPASTGDGEGEVEVEWVSRRLLSRMHAYSRRTRRSSVRSVTAQDFMRFLLRWQHVAPGTQVGGEPGLVAVLEQLQGYESPAVAWEPELLTRRLRHYDARWLDRLCHDGQVAWLRLTPRANDDESPSLTAPSKATPISVVLRDDLGWLMAAARIRTGTLTPAVEPTVGATAEIIEALRTRGASFAGELGPVTGRLPQDVERALWDGMARGLITCDGFGAIRARVAPERPPTRNPALRPVRMSRLGRLSRATNAAAGRWSLVPPADEGIDQHELAEVVAEQLLNRWGVVFRDLAIRDDLRLPWRDIQWALRRLEDRGLVRGGRFVAGFNGEQYALPTAIEQLDHVRKSPRTGERVTVNATDPLNLVGVIVPGATVASVRTNHVVFVDGVPEDGPVKAAPGPARGTDRGTGGELAGSGPPTPDRVAARVVWAGSP